MAGGILSIFDRNDGEQPLQAHPTPCRAPVATVAIPAVVATRVKNARRVGVLVCSLLLKDRSFEIGVASFFVVGDVKAEVDTFCDVETSAIASGPMIDFLNTLISYFC